MPTVDTFCMNLYLAEISHSVAEDVQVVLVLDQAGWHVSKALKVPANISIILLPPYSPELNPVELLWLYLKSHYLSNRLYPDHDALFQAGIEAWNNVTATPELIASLCNISWAYWEN
jgi:transposase